MSNLSAIQAAVAAVAAVSQDETVAQSFGGGDYEPPAEGICFARFVGYVETGKHEGRPYQGRAAKVTDEVQVIFELGGKKHAPRELDDGTKLPHRITIKLNKSLSERATYFKLFKQLNYNGTAKVMPELLGQGYIARVYHKTVVGQDGKERVYAGLRDPDTGAFSFKPPVKEDVETGESVPLKVPEALSEFRFFSFGAPSLEQWANVYIDGEYPERTDDNGKVIAPAKSKNVFQDRIKAALNFEGSAIAELLEQANLDPGALPEEADTPDEPDEPEAAPAPKKSVAKPVKPKAAAAAKAPAKKAAKVKPKVEPADDGDDDPLAAFDE